MKPQHDMTAVSIFFSLTKKNILKNRVTIFGFREYNVGNCFTKMLKAPSKTIKLIL